MGTSLYEQYLAEQGPDSSSSSLYDQYLEEQRKKKTVAPVDTGDIVLPPAAARTPLAAARIARARGTVADAAPEGAFMTGARSVGMGVSTVGRTMLHGLAGIDENLADTFGTGPSKLAELAAPIEKRMIQNEAALRPSEESIGAHPWASAGGETAGEFSAGMLPYAAAGIAARPLLRGVTALTEASKAGSLGSLAEQTLGRLAPGSGGATAEGLKTAARALVPHTAVNVAPGLVMDPQHNPLEDPTTIGFSLLGALSEGRAPHPTPARADGGRSAMEIARQKLAQIVHPETGQELQTTKEQRDIAQREADTDHMTGLGNKRAFDRARPAAEADPATSIVRLDINGTKSVNDIHGHQTGDKVITGVAEAMMKASAELGIGDRTFRVGGDEFNAIVPADKAEAFRNRVEELYGVQDHGAGVKTSVSGGIGPTDAAADAAAYVRKNAHKAEQGIVDPRAAGGIVVPPAPPPAAGESPGIAPSSRIVSHPVADLHVDPSRFQFKLDVNERGVGRHLASVDKFNPELAGSIAVWRDPADGKTYVVNGHHRYDLAKRTGTKNIDVHYVDAPTAEIARAKGALANIAEGQGTALDAAKFFRDTKTGPEDLKAEGVDLTGRIAKSGVSLSKLEPDVFAKVASGKISENHGAIIGGSLELPEMQRAAANLVENSPKKLTDAQVQELVAQVRQAGTENVKQDNLFGTDTEGTSLIYHRADVAAEIKKRLTADKKLFGYVSKGTRGEDLSRGGNTINVESSGQIARQSAVLEEVFNAEAHMAGEVGSSITEAARRVANGEKLRTVVDDIYGPIREAVSRAIPRAAAGGGSVRPGSSQGGEPPAQEVAAAGSGQEGAPGSEVIHTETAQEAKARFGPGDRIRYKGELGVVDVQNPRNDRLLIMLEKDNDGRIVHTVDPREVELLPDKPDPNQEAMFAPLGRKLVPKGIERIASAALKIGDTVVEGRFHHDAWQKALDEGILKPEEAPDLHEGFMTTPTAEHPKGRFVDRETAYEIADRADQIRQENSGNRERGRANLGAEDLPYGGAAYDSPNPEKPELDVNAKGGLDLFGNRTEPDTPAQESLFGGKEGTADSRNLKQSEAAARSELEKLREQLPRETNPAKKVAAARRISELEKLVNRDKAITSKELETRAIAADGDMGLFSPATKGPLRRRVAKILGREAPDPGKVEALIDITRKLAKATNPAVRQGRAMLKQRKALGVFFVKSEAIRVRRLDDVSTVAHEIGHYLSKNYLGHPTRKPGRGAATTSAPKIHLSGLAKDELVQMGQDLYGSRKPAGGYGEEGIAQYFSFYVTDPGRMKLEAPNFHAALEAELYPKEPALKAALDQAQVDYADHVKAPASARLDAMISVGENVRNKPSVRAIVHSMFDKLNEFKLAVDELGGERAPERNAYTLARLVAGDAGIAEEMIERGITNWDTGARETRGIAEILSEIKPERLQAFRRYLVAERSLEVAGRGIKAGIDYKDAFDTINELKDEFGEPAAELWDISQKLIDYRQGAGLLTEQEADMIKAKNQKRVGFYRVFEDWEAASKAGGAGSGYGRNSSGIQKMKGSARKIIDPLESILTDVYKTIHQAKTHEVLKTLVDHARRVEGGARVAEVLTERPQHLVKIPIEKVINQLLELGFEIPENMPEEKVIQLATGVLEDFQFNTTAGPRESKDMIVPYIKDGKRFWVQLKDRRLYDSIKGLDREDLPLWLRAVSWPTRTLRAGATLSLEFIGRNPVRDAFDAAIYSSAGFKPPGYHFAKGVFSLLGKDAMYQQWRLEGGDHAAMTGLDRSTVQRSLKEFVRSGPKKMLDVVIHPINTLRVLSSITENATRIGEYKMLREQGVPAKGAAFASRDLTIDFARSGAAGKNLNRIIAFFNANLQGSAKMVREIRSRPAAVLPRIAAAITMPSLALWYLQKDDPAYREIPRWQKDLFWIWVDRGEDGKVSHIWRVPKPFEVGILFGSAPERIAEYIHTKDPHSFDKLIQTVIGGMTPGLIPTGVQPLVENWGNRSYFRDRPIVPRGVERFDPPHQAGRFASETARQLGALFNYPPAKIDNLIRGWGGGLATDYIVKATDAALRGARHLVGSEPLSTPSSREGPLPTKLPGIRGFTIREPGADAESVEMVYKQYSAAEERRQTWKSLLEQGRKTEARKYFIDHKEEILSVVTSEDAGTAGRLRTAYQVIGKLQDVAHELEDATMPIGQRQERLRSIFDAMIRVAQKATGREVPAPPPPDPVAAEIERLGAKVPAGAEKVVEAVMASPDYQRIPAIAEQLVRADPKYHGRDKSSLVRELKKDQIEGAVAAYGQKH